MTGRTRALLEEMRGRLEVLAARAERELPPGQENR
jgi:hypothetical protein